MVRVSDDLPSDRAVVVLNPGDEVTAESLTAWLDERQSGEPTDPGATAAETSAKIRATGEA